MKKKKFKKIVLWLLLVGWMTIIFLFSNQNGTTSTDVSNGVLTFVLRIMPIDIGPYLLRKVAHFLEYMILGILILLLIREYKKITTREIVFGILFCILYACSDEFHQMFISGRSPGVFDVMIDTFGSMSGIFLLYFLIFPSSKE